MNPPVPSSDPLAPPARPAATRVAPWMISFADLISLLLCFFVLLYSMSAPRPAAVSALREALAPRANRGDESLVAQPVPPLNPPSKVRPRALDLGYLSTVLATKLDGDALLWRADIEPVDRGLVLSLPVDLLFEPGGMAMTANARRAISALTEIFLPVANRIELVGRAEPGPDADMLSLARAVAVADAMRQDGYDRPIAAFGAGDAGFAKAFAWAPEAERRRRANRVELVVRDWQPAGTTRR